MVKKIYDWDGVATLDDHKKKKHTILREYFRQYLITRCKIPKREKLPLIIVDGFSGARIYTCGRLLEGVEWNGFPWQIVPKAILSRMNV